jgi:hypothetical protein
MGRVSNSETPKHNCKALQIPDPLSAKDKCRAELVKLAAAAAFRITILLIIIITINIAQTSDHSRA